MSEAEPVALIELSNSYYIFELFKTENIQKKIDNKLVRQKILLSHHQLHLFQNI